MYRLLTVLVMVSVAVAGTIDRDLEMLIGASADTDHIPVFILAYGQVDRNWVNNSTDGMSRAERQEFAVQAMQQLADASQENILINLRAVKAENIQSLWLANAVYCEATPAAIRQMAARSDVMLIERAAGDISGLIEPVDVRETTPEEDSKALAWGVEKINADDVWAMGYEGAGVIVGVIDTGVDYNHTDLNTNMWHDTPAGLHLGYDFYDSDDDPMDDYGHGTHCCGSVAGDGTAGTETGVAPSATIMGLRINYYSGGEYTWVQAMEFGADHGASVLSMSLGSTHGNTTLRTAEENLLTAGVYHSVAAANSGPAPGTILSSGDSPPPWFHPDQTHHGGQSAVVTVGATDISDNIANFSSRGPVTWWSDYSDSTPLIDPDISGPGVDITSCRWSGYSGSGPYTVMSGTSMATPHLAGVAALLLSVNSNLTVAQLDSLIEVTSVDLGASGKDNTYGAGRVDAYAAAQAALGMSSAEEETEAAVEPSFVGISAISPNPVVSHAVFTVNAVSAGFADIGVYDVTGRRAANISSDELSAGANAFSWQIPSSMGSGIYFVRATMNGRTVSSRMTVLR
ncbi:hypothetical protein CSA37_11075 [Candidatus Fermentibacteria bacterium]|nr:MAG: hypothetical protein CSA37_11075 [Candidatus Fermentibacteria bacterium]